MSNTPRIEKTDTMTFALHWALFCTLIFSLSTGLRISADTENSIWARALDPILLQGDVMHWHVWAAYALTLIAIAYVIFLSIAQLRSRVALDRARIGSLAAPNRALRWNRSMLFCIGSLSFYSAVRCLPAQYFILSLDQFLTTLRFYCIG